MSNSKPYSYFDTPDGHDVGKKLLFVLKPATFTAVAATVIDVMAYSKPKGYMNTLGRFGVIGLPIIGISAAFVLTTNGVTSLRKKDDRLNWFIGGLAAGGLVGAWFRRPMVGLNTGIFFGLLGIMRKDAQINGYPDLLIASEPRKQQIAFGGVWSATRDWSMIAERPRNWTTGKE